MAGRARPAVVVPQGDTIHSPMSRHSTPSSALGRLDLLTSSSSSSSGMPVQTRAARRKGKEEESRQASSGRGARTPAVTAGPSRTSGTARRPYPGRQSASRRATQASRTIDPEDDDDAEGGGDDDDDEDDEDDEDENESEDDEAGSNIDRTLLAICEHLCAHTHDLLTPFEFYRLHADSDGSRDQQLRQRAEDLLRNRPLAAVFVPREHRLSSMVERLGDRWNRITKFLEADIAFPGSGTNVPKTISCTRVLFRAIGEFILYYMRNENVLQEQDKERLAILLGTILYWIRVRDKNVYAGNGRTMAPYSDLSTVNPYRAFSGTTGQVVPIMLVLQSLPDEILQREHLKENIDQLYRYAQQSGRENVAWLDRMWDVYQRCNA